MEVPGIGRPTEPMLKSVLKLRVAPAVVSGHTEYLWAYVVSTILGAILAVFVFKLTRKEKING